MVICQASPKYHTLSTYHEAEPPLLQPDTSITLFHMKLDKNPTVYGLTIYIPPNSHVDKEVEP